MQAPFPLPPEVHRNIFELSGIDALFPLSSVNKYCHKLANDDLIWSKRSNIFLSQLLGNFYNKSFGDSYFSKMASRHLRRQKSTPNVRVTQKLAKLTGIQSAIFATSKSIIDAICNISKNKK